MPNRKDSDIPLVTWSRHMTTIPEPTQSKPTNINKKISNLDDYKRRQLNLAGRLKAISESSFNYGAEVMEENDQNESWDSQSDPGSTSNPKSFPRLRKKLKKPVKKRDAEQKNKLQQRKNRQPSNATAVGSDNKCVVEISREPLPADKTITRDYYCSQKLLESYIDFMYYCCLTPRRWDKEESDETSKRKLALSVIQKVMFCYIGVMSTFTSFSLTKYIVLQFDIDRSMNNFIDIGFFTVCGSLQVYFTYFLAFKHDEMSTIFRACKSFDLMTKGDKVPTLRNKATWVPIVNGILSIIMSAVKILTLAESVEQMILRNSEDTAETFMLWSPDQTGNTTSITETYGAELNWTTVTLGTFGIISNFCCSVQMDCYKDLIFWIAKYNESHILAFGKKVRKCLATKMETGKNSKVEDDDCWEMYRKVKKVDSLLNEKLYFVLIIIHLNSFMTFSFFLTYLLNDKVNKITTFLIGYNTMKGILSYIPGQRASRENDLCRKWIQTLPCETQRFCVGETSFTREVMLYELEKEPLGLGNGKLHVNSEFIFTFLTLVTSLFCYLLSIENKHEEITKY